MDKINDKQFSFLRLRFMRELRGYKTPGSAARAHGWCYSTYKSHEAGKTIICYSTAFKYAQAYEIILNWLLYGESEDASISRD